jgi:hypothetical protein
MTGPSVPDPLLIPFAPPDADVIPNRVISHMVEVNERAGDAMERLPVLVRALLAVLDAPDLRTARMAAADGLCRVPAPAATR